MKIVFTKNSKYIYISVDERELPQTIIKCESDKNDEILSICQNWLDALNLTDVEYEVNVRIH